MLPLVPGFMTIGAAPSRRALSRWRSHGRRPSHGAWDLTGSLRRTRGGRRLVLVANSEHAPEFPAFLRSLEDLQAHFDEEFAGLTNVERGRRFSELVLRLIPELDEARDFPEPRRSEKESYDEGIDLLTSTNSAGDQLFVQSKYKIRTKDEFDTIVSKFEAYAQERNQPLAQGSLDFGGQQFKTTTATFMVVTASKLDVIIEKYEKSHLSSRAFYDRLVAEKRLTKVHGPAILSELQRLYSRSFVLPSDVKLESLPGWISHDNVHIGMVRARDIATLHTKYGDGLFFENIRDFLGPESGRRRRENRQSVNANIIETAKTEPTKMLARNNGVTFRAAGVERQGKTIVLVSGASIVNGCQTTMCLVHAGALDMDCYVPVKIVETADAWEVARAANYQNQVNQIDLDLARYLRPQLVQKAAGDLGYSLTSSEVANLTSVLDAIHQRRVDYDEVKALYLGLFSRKPNNLWEDNYTELRSDVMQRLYERNEQEEIFSTLFMLVTSGRVSLQRCEDVFKEQEYGHIFKRFHEQDRGKYRSYLAVMTTAGFLGENLQQRSDKSNEEADRMIDVLRQIRAKMETEAKQFERAYMMAYQVLADVALEAMHSAGGGSTGERVVLQEMHKRISGASFDGLYTRLRMRLDAERALRAEDPFEPK
jgi:hypothetical protein